MSPAMIADDEALVQFARDFGFSTYHGSGTCRMGGDEASVVDPQLRVRGVANLRVADASIMPRLISGNTNAACIMIGEKAAELLAAARQRPQQEQVAHV
jgi:choline dehydrogenase